MQPKGTSQCGRTSALGVTLVLGIVAVLLLPGAAKATFPGVDGRIAYIGFAPGSVQEDIYTVRPDGSDVRQLTNDPTVEDWPSWSANGRRLLFVRERGGNDDLYSMRSDGTDVSLLARNVSEVRAGFSPSGRRVVYASRRALHIVHSDGTRDRIIVTARHFSAGLSSPEFSPNGKRIAFFGAATGASDGGIWTMRPDGSGLRRLTSSNSDANPDFSPDGKHIVFVHFPPDHCCNTILAMRSDGSRRHAIRSLANPGTAVYSPSGDRMAVDLHNGNYLGPQCGALFTATPAGQQLSPITFGCNADGTGGAGVGAPNWQPLPEP